MTLGERLGLALLLVVAIWTRSCWLETAQSQSVSAADIMAETRRESAPARHAPRVPPDIYREEPAVLLARTAWREAGPRVGANEVAAFHAVITHRAGVRHRYQVAAWNYSVGLRNPRHASTHRLGRSPLRNYPAVFIENWPRVLAAADAAVAGTLTHGCVGEPEHWGGPHVDRHALRRLIRAGYQDAQCPNTNNTFLWRPRR